MSSNDAPFVGRERQLAALHEAFKATRNNRPVIVHVHGSSGMGKTALVRRFVDDLARRSEAVVLSGRCYERETVPYKALDPIVDALSAHLRRLPRDELVALLPREVYTLARVFPVLMRVEDIASAPRRAEIPDPQELRLRALAAMRELVARITDRRPLVVWIDDLQWGDVDSAAVLAEITRGPDAPPILLVLGYRSEDVGTSAVLASVRDPKAQSEGGADVREIDVSALSRDEACDLALSFLGADQAKTARRDEAAVASARAIAEESGGNAFFIGELARHVREGGGSASASADAKLTRSASGRALRLADVLHARIEALPAPARRLIEIVSVAGRPIAREVAAQAANLGSGDEQAALATLRTAHLVRGRRVRNRDELETFHDRIRETVVARLEPDVLRSRHAKIAWALETSRQGDAEALSLHFEAAGHAERAAKYARAAADAAAEALAFDRAVHSYRKALELVAQPQEVDRALRWKLGQALANAGRGAEAAEEFLRAAEGASAADRLELQRNAAEQLLKNGRIDQGVDAIRKVLASVGLTLPETPRRALLHIAAFQLYLGLRGHGYKTRDESQVAPEDLRRIDVCWTIATGFAVVDNIRAVEFQKRGLLLALRAGEPYRIARALATEVASSAVTGASASARTAKIAERATALLDRVRDPHARGFTILMRALAAYLEGRWTPVVSLAEQAEEIFRNECTGAWWELANARLIRAWGWILRGDLAHVASVLPSFIAEAEERGDLYLSSNLRLGRMNSVWLAADDPARARREAEEATARWTRRSVHLQHYYALFARAQAAMYEGDGGAALAAIDAEWASLRSALIFRIQTVRVEALHLRARAALIAAESVADPERPLGIARADARRLLSESTAWARPAGELLLAGVSAARGQRGEAARHAERAASGYASVDMALLAAIARRRAAELSGGDDAARTIREADDAMTAQHIKAPSRFAALYAPGFGVLRGGRMLGTGR